MKPVYPELNAGEVSEAFLKLQIPETSRQSKQQLENILSAIAESHHDAEVPQIALSSNDLASQTELNSYALLLVYKYCNKPAYLEIVKDHAISVSRALENVLPFGQVYGVLVMTKLLEYRQQETMQFFLDTHFIEKFVNLLEMNNFPQHEVQLIQMTFACLNDVHLTLTPITKQQLIDLVARKFQEKLAECDQFTLVYLEALKAICFNPQFKQEVLEMKILTISCISLSAFFMNQQLTQKKTTEQLDGEVINSLITMISYCFTLIHQIEAKDRFDIAIEQALEIVQEMDIFRIFQVMSAHNPVCVQFFSFNASLRQFCSTSIYRFNTLGPKQADCLPLSQFVQFLVQQSAPDAIEYLAGCCLDQQVLMETIQDSALLQAVYNAVQTWALKKKCPETLAATTKLLDAFFRFPAIFVNYQVLDMPRNFTEGQDAVLNHAEFVEEWFKLILKLIQTFPESDTLVENLFQIAQLRINLMPFLHQVSTIDLVRNKFTLCQDRAKMPNPSGEEIEALVHLLKLKNIKVGALICYALRLFSRYVELQKTVFEHKQAIVENCANMLDSLYGINAQLAKFGDDVNQERRIALLIVCTQETLVEVLKLLCSVPLDSKALVHAAHVLQLWVASCSDDDRFATETAKFVRQLIVFGGKSLIKLIKGNSALEAIAGLPKPKEEQGPAEAVNE